MKPAPDVLVLDVTHVPGCFASCGGIYRCNRCGRLCGWCFGAADDTPGICDDCLLEIGHVEDEEDRKDGSHG